MREGQMHAPSSAPCARIFDEGLSWPYKHTLLWDLGDTAIVLTPLDSRLCENRASGILTVRVVVKAKVEEIQVDRRLNKVEGGGKWNPPYHIYGEISPTDLGLRNAQHLAESISN